MKFISYIVVIMVVIFTISPVFADVIGRTNEEVEEIASPLLDNILEGLATDDYKKYVRDFDATLKEIVSEQRFHEIDEQIQNWVGDYLYREYLGFLKRGEMCVIFWKGIFDKSKDEILIKLSVSKRGDRYLVTGLWFE